MLSNPLHERTGLNASAFAVPQNDPSPLHPEHESGLRPAEWAARWSPKERRIIACCTEARVPARSKEEISHEKCIRRCVTWMVRPSAGGSSLHGGSRATPTSPLSRFLQSCACGALSTVRRLSGISLGRPTAQEW